MFRTVNVGKYSTVKLPDTFEPAVIETNTKANKGKDTSEKELRAVNVHFGRNMEVVVCVAKSKKLEGIDLERIELLVGAR